MNCSSLFSLKKKKNIMSLSSAEFAHKVVKVKDVLPSHKHQCNFSFCVYCNLILNQSIFSGLTYLQYYYFSHFWTVIR